MQDGRSIGTEGVERELVQEPCAERAAEDQQHRANLGQAEQASAFRLGDRSRPRRDRSPRHPVLRAVASVDRERQEDPARERRRQAVRQTEVRVGLHHRRGNPSPRGCVDHRSGDVAAAAEDDVGSPRPQNPGTRSGRASRQQKRTCEGERRPARQTGDGERVELEAGFRNEPSLDAIGRSCERHPHAAALEHLRDCERRHDVSRCPAGRDQAPQLSPVLH